MATPENFAASKVFNATVSVFVYSLVAGFTAVGAFKSLRDFYKWINRL